MYPQLFHIGSVTIYSYGTFIFIGACLGYMFLTKRWRSIGLSNESLKELVLLIVVAAFIGGKFFYFLENPGYYSSNWKAFMISFGNGFVFYGSLLFAFLIIIGYCKKKKLNPWMQLDFMVITGTIVHGFGKIGCFLAGCCYGKVCSKGWYSVKFTNSNSLAFPLNQDLYATQIYDAILIFIILGLLLLVEKRKQFHGQLLLLYIVVYSVGRIFTEIYRGDIQRGFLFNGSLSHSQFIAICLLLGSIFIYLFRSKFLFIK